MVMITLLVQREVSFIPYCIVLCFEGKDTVF